MLRKLSKFTILLLTVASCADSVPQQGEVRDLQVGISVDLLSPDVQIIEIPDITVDAYVDPCADVRNIDEDYCECFPRCCQRQTWYCPPLGTEIQAKTAVLDICGEDLVPCDRNIDLDCPPAEIIYESACQHAFDCPPGINEEFVLIYDCEVDGVSGTQEVKCDKGRLYYGECITCVVSDEICDFVDNDCDGNTDENKRNVCNGCGDVPQDMCDGLDNDCDDIVDEELVRECSTACNRGIETCQSGQWVSCTARQPSVEQCDGQDNDCDQLIDEGVSCECPPEIVGALIPCMEPPLSCGLGFKTCECEDEECTVTSMSECFAPCHWFEEIQIPDQECDPLVGLPINPEVCNDFDEDCDTVIDEDLFRDCYSGPAETVGIGVCTNGQQYCDRGQWAAQDNEGNVLVDFCSGEVLPTEEVCDGSDNDCDGITDYGEEIPDTDILFIIDWSGSMEDYIRAVSAALNRFAQHFSAEDNIKWGLVIGPKEHPTQMFGGTSKEMLILNANISEFEQFLIELANAGEFGGTSKEMMKDALMLAIYNITGNPSYDRRRAAWSLPSIGSEPELDRFVLNWRPNADRIIILFTDEEEQTYLSPNVTNQQLLDMLTATPNLKLYVFSEGLYSNRWEVYANPTGGFVFELSRNQQRMYNDLMSIIDDICAGAEVQMGMNDYLSSPFALVSHSKRYDYANGVCY